MARRLILTLFALTLLVTAPALGQGSTLVLDTSQDPVNLVPHIATSVDFYLLRNAYEPLVEVAPDGVTIVGVLASSWTVSQDGLSVDLTLRDDVTFADGTPFVAEAVAKSIERLKTLQRGSAWVVDPINEVTILGEHEIRLRLERPFPLLAALPLVYIVSPTAIADQEVDGDHAASWLGENTAGSGPYQLLSWQRGQRIEFGRNESYWGGWSDSNFERVVVLPQLDPSVARLMLESGDLDAALVFSFDDIPAFEANPEIDVFAAPTLQQLYLRLNNRYGPTADARVREAISIAWNPADWQAIVRNTLPPDGPAPLELLSAGYESASIVPERDMERARALMADAGYANGFTLNYLWDNPYEYKRIFGELLQAHLTELNIRVNMIAVAPATFFERVQSVEADGDSASAIHSFLLRAVPRIPDAYSFLYFLYYSEAQEGFGRNFLLYANADVDALIENAIRATDTAEKIALYEQANDIIINDRPDLFVEKTVFTLPIRSDFEGFVFRPSDQWFPFRFYEMSRAN